MTENMQSLKIINARSKKIYDTKTGTDIRIPIEIKANLNNEQ